MNNIEFKEKQLKETEHIDTGDSVVDLLKAILIVLEEINKKP